MITVWSGYIDGGNSGEIEFDSHTGLFSYSVEGYQSDLREIFSSTMARNVSGYATLTELPRWLQKEAEESLTCSDYAKAKLTAQTVYCDGYLVVSYNKF